MKVGVSIVPCIPGGLDQPPDSSLVPPHFFWRWGNEWRGELGIRLVCLHASWSSLELLRRGPVFPIPLRYEEEVALRATAENEFVALKKVSA